MATGERVVKLPVVPSNRSACERRVKMAVATATLIEEHIAMATPVRTLHRHGYEQEVRTLLWQRCTAIATTNAYFPPHNFTLPKTPFTPASRREEPSSPGLPGPLATRTPWTLHRRHGDRRRHSNRCHGHRRVGGHIVAYMSHYHCRNNRCCRASCVRERSDRSLSW